MQYDDTSADSRLRINPRTHSFLLWANFIVDY